MARTSLIDPYLIDAVRAAGREGTSIKDVFPAIEELTGGTRTLRGVASRAAELVRQRKLARRFGYFTPEGMKSPIRHHIYLAPEYVTFGDPTIEFGE